MRIVLDTPQSLESLRKLYNDKAIFYTTTKSYPLITEIEVPRDYLSAMRKRLVPVRVGKRVNKLIAQYTKRLQRVWDKETRQIEAALHASAKSVTKADGQNTQAKLRPEDLDKIQALRDSLKRMAKPMFRSAYQLGKERGQILTNQEINPDLSDEDLDRLEEKEDWNDEHLGSLIDALTANYAATMSRDYESEAELEQALSQASGRERHRLANFAGALGAGLLAAGMGQAVLDIQVIDETTGIPTGEVKDDPDTGLPLGELFEGGYWRTSHDERVCNGCESNDGKWMTIEQFQDEANTNECLSNCRCIELFEPAPVPDDPRLLWEGTPGLQAAMPSGEMQKGGTGSGSWDGLGQSRFAWTPPQQNVETGRYESATYATEVPEQWKVAPKPRAIRGKAIKYDESSYRPEYWPRHVEMERQIESGINRLPESHAALLADITIDDNMRYNPGLSDKLKADADNIFAFTDKASSKITFNAGMPDRLFKGKSTHEETILHEIGHVVMEQKVFSPARAMRAEGKDIEVNEIKAQWADVMNSVVRAHPTFYREPKETLLRHNELSNSPHEIGAGLYRAYLAHGDKFQRLFPAAYEVVKTRLFAGKEYRRGKEVKKVTDESQENVTPLYEYELENGQRIYTIAPIAALEKFAKHLPGQHDQLDHAGGRTPRQEEPTEASPAATTTVGEEAPVSVEPEHQTVLREVLSGLPEETIRRMQELREKLRTGETTKSKHFDENTKQYTPERQALHNTIVDSVMTGTSTSQEPTLILTGGLPGSGKSSITRQKDLGNYVKIDSDAIKAKLPEYEGWNAALLQTEVDDIIGRLFVQAVKERKNILFDGTMKSYNKYNALIDRFSNFGYKIGVWFADLPMKDAMQRAVARFEHEGRFVDPTYIATHNGHNSNTYERLKHEVDFYERYDTKVPQGHPAKLKEQGHASAPKPKR